MKGEERQKRRQQEKREEEMGRGDEKSREGK
jgi:hypothetical protein